MIIAKQKTRFIKVECVFCDGTGWYLVGEYTPTAYRCRCANGRQLPEYVPQYHGICERRYPTKDELQVYADVRKKMQEPQAVKPISEHTPTQMASQLKDAFAKSFVSMTAEKDDSLEEPY